MPGLEAAGVLSKARESSGVFGKVPADRRVTPSIGAIPAIVRGHVSCLMVSDVAAPQILEVRMSKEVTLTRRPDAGDPFALMRAMTSELDRLFEGFDGPAFQPPFFRARPPVVPANWIPEIEVFEKDNRLVTKVDLPGMKKEDVKVEVTDGHLTISGERKSNVEEKKDQFYRSERQYGSFYRAVPLPDGIKLEDVKATFAEGVLEVSIPLPVAPESKVRKVEIQDGAKASSPVA
jgi:HSP20 family protein